MAMLLFIHPGADCSAMYHHQFELSKHGSRLPATQQPRYSKFTQRKSKSELLEIYFLSIHPGILFLVNKSKSGHKIIFSPVSHIFTFLEEKYFFLISSPNLLFPSSYMKSIFLVFSLDYCFDFASSCIHDRFTFLLANIFTFHYFILYWKSKFGLETELSSLLLLLSFLRRKKVLQRIFHMVLLFSYWKSRYGIETEFPILFWGSCRGFFIWIQPKYTFPHRET
jgi:hypothetical protein